ncbi:hypothetical protein ACVI1K_005367 [Bradyrhizobium sp. USDA 4508]
MSVSQGAHTNRVCNPPQRAKPRTESTYKRGELGNRSQYASGRTGTHYNVVKFTMNHRVLPVRGVVLSDVRRNVVCRMERLSCTLLVAQIWK